MAQYSNFWCKVEKHPQSARCLLAGLDWMILISNCCICFLIKLSKACLNEKHLFFRVVGVSGNCQVLDHVGWPTWLWVYLAWLFKKGISLVFWNPVAYHSVILCYFTALQSYARFWKLRSHVVLQAVVCFSIASKNKAASAKIIPAPKETCWMSNIFKIVLPKYRII